MITIDYTLIIVVLNFILLLIILNKILYKPILKFLEERKNKISKDIDAAKKSKLEAAKLVDEKKQVLIKSAEEVRSLKNAARREADRKADDILKEAHERDKKMMQNTENQLLNEKEKVIKDIQSEIAVMVANVSEKVLMHKLTDATDKELIEKIVSEREEK